MMNDTISKAAWDAARKGDWEQVCSFIEKEPALIHEDGWSYDVCEDTMRHDFPMFSFLHVAAATASEIKHVRFFLEHGLDMNIENEYGTPPIFYAACNPNIEILRFFIESGADIHEHKRSETTLLHFAVANNRNIEVVKFLVAKGLDVNKPSQPFRETPLHFAVSAGNVEAMLYLAENGANLNAGSDYFCGGTPLMILLGDDYIKIDVPLIQRFIDLGADPNALDIRKFTPLSNAGRRNLDILKCLVKNGATIDKEKSPGVAPLHCAAMNPNLGNIKYLIELGADVLAVGPNGETLLHVAAKSNPNVEMLDFLVGQGVDINAKMYGSQMAIHEALERRCDFDILKFLVEHGSDLNTVGSSWHKTPLQEVVLWCDSNVKRDKYKYAKYLVEYGADWTVKTSWGANFLHLSNEVNLSEYFVALGLDVNAVDDNGKTPVMNAAIQGAPDLLKYLVSQGGKLDVRDNEGKTPLHRAASWDRGMEVCEYLIENGADIDAKDNKGFTPLDLAATDEKKKLLQEFIRNRKQVED